MGVALVTKVAEERGRPEVMEALRRSNDAALPSWLVYPDGNRKCWISCPIYVVSSLGLFICWMEQQAFVNDVKKCKWEGQRERGRNETEMIGTVSGQPVTMTVHSERLECATILCFSATQEKVY